MPPVLLLRSPIRILTIVVAIGLVLATVTLASPLEATASPPTDEIVLVDTTQGLWHLGIRDGEAHSIYFGDPGDAPMLGDWDCDGIATPGLYRQTDGYVYLRNSSTQGIADIRFFFGNPGDVPLAGDFDGDGCDTVSIYRPAEQRFYIINSLGSDDGGLGAADYSYLFGVAGDKPFVGDFDGDGTDSVGLHRESSGYVYFRNTSSTGIADHEFYFGDPGDLLFAGDWHGTGTETPGVYRPMTRTAHLRYSNTQGNADESVTWGLSHMVPVAGQLGELPDGPTECTILPPDNIWNRAIDDLPVHPRSADYIARIGATCW